MVDASRDSDLTASRVDIKCLSYGYVLKCPVVTDDFDMIALGEMFSVEMIKTVELLKLMLDKKHISMDKIDEIVQYLSYQKDLPKDFKSDYKKIFGSNPKLFKKK